MLTHLSFCLTKNLNLHTKKKQYETLISDIVTLPCLTWNNVFKSFLLMEPLLLVIWRKLTLADMSDDSAKYFGNCRQTQFVICSYFPWRKKVCSFHLAFCNWHSIYCALCQQKLTKAPWKYCYTIRIFPNIACFCLIFCLLQIWPQICYKIQILAAQLQHGLLCIKQN